jgi:hypothetical protein
MKKFYVLALSGLLLAACSDDLTDIDNNESSADDARYMSISVVANNTSSTRADYANGESNENAIYNVVFYFFDKDGNKFNVNTNSDGAAVNYRLPYTTGVGNDTPNKTDGTNVALTKAVVVIEPEVKGTVPAQVVAVVNYDENQTLKALSLEELRKQELSTGTISKTSGEGTSATTTTYYTMSNSVYVKSTPATTEDDEVSTATTTTGTIMYATPITSENFASTTTAANAHSVQIYVERVLGKVSTSFLLSGKTEATTPDATATTNLPSFSVDEGGKAYNVTTWANNQFGSAEVSLSAQIVGWNYYNQSIKTTLEKNIDTYTGYDKLLNTTNNAWNSEANFRSFWADSTEQPTLTTYTETVNSQEVTRTKNTGKLSYTTMKGNFGAKYTFENTCQRTEFATGVVYAAQLINNSTNSAYSLVKWLSSYYTPDAALHALANYLQNDLCTYTAASETQTAASWAPITADDIQLTQETGDYHSVVTLSTTGATKKFYAKGSTTELTSAQITAIFAKIPRIQYWNEGMCYYYTTFSHLGYNEGKIKGVVRNHWYQLTINGISGLGTPVADDSEAVVPTRPTEDEWYLSTSINVLAWRYYQQTISLVSK